MTKYIRSAQKLMTLVKEIFAVSEFSIDTKAIVLLLAGTMPSDKFGLWIDEINALDSIKDKYKAVNYIKEQLGIACSKYILLKILKKIEGEINSEELQQFISAARSAKQAKLFNPELDIVIDVNKRFTCLYDASVNGVTSTGLR